MQIGTTTGMLALRHTSDAQALQAIAQAGFQAVDFSMWNYPWQGGLFALPDTAFDAYFTGLRATADTYGLTISQAHAPFPSTTGNEPEDTQRLQVLKRAIRAAARLGCAHIVIHPSLHTGCIHDIGHEQAMETNTAMYRALAPECARWGVKIAIENMFTRAPDSGQICPTFLSTAREMVALLEVLGPDCFCACLDIGHGQLAGEGPAEMARVLGRWLQVLHVHDNNGAEDGHTLPFLGVVDFEGIMRALQEIGYAGGMSLEADNILDVFPREMEGAVLRMMAETAGYLAGRVGR